MTENDVVGRYDDEPMAVFYHGALGAYLRTTPEMAQYIQHLADNRQGEWTWTSPIGIRFIYADKGSAVAFWPVEAVPEPTPA